MSPAVMFRFLVVTSSHFRGAAFLLRACSFAGRTIHETPSNLAPRRLFLQNSVDQADGDGAFAYR
jgi:hypothetical protein